MLARSVVELRIAGRSGGNMEEVGDLAIERQPGFPPSGEGYRAIAHLGVIQHAIRF